MEHEFSARRIDQNEIVFLYQKKKGLAFNKFLYHKNVVSLQSAGKDGYLKIFEIKEHLKLKFFFFLFLPLL